MPTTDGRMFRAMFAALCCVLPSEDARLTSDCSASCSMTRPRSGPIAIGSCCVGGSWDTSGDVEEGLPSVFSTDAGATGSFSISWYAP